MPRRWLRGLLTACAWLTLSTPAIAQSDSPPRALGELVVSQSVAIDARPASDPALLELIQTRVGAPLSAAAVRETIAHFMGLGRFDDVVVSVAPVPGGVAVSYDLMPTRAVRRVAFRGHAAVSERLLRERIEERFGAAFPLARLDDLTPFLESVYRDQGYLQARVTPRPEIVEPGSPDALIVDVESGPRVTLSDVIAEGNAPMALTDIPRRLGLAAGQFYRKGDVDRKLEKLVADLREQGYYEARADHQLRPGTEAGSAVLAINVDGGARITVVFEGDELPQKERRALVPIEREGSVDEDLLEDSANRIEEHLRSQGYRDAHADHERTPRDGGLAVVFKVRRGLQFRTARVTLIGARAVPEADLRALLRTREGALFVEGVVQSDAATLAEQYRRRGYTQVRVEATSIPAAGNASPVPVDVQLTVTEGPRTVVGAITIGGQTAVDEAALRAGISSKTGQPYYQQQVALDHDGILLVLLNRGYSSAVVDPRVTFTPDRSSAAVAFVVTEGPQVFVEHVLVVGNVKTSTETIRREITLQPGAPLSYAEVTESQRRISGLGLFRRVRITELDHGEPNRRDLLVTVEEAPATTVGYGGGVEGGQRLRRVEPGGSATEVFELAPRGFVEYARRNLFGRNQSINLFARASLRTKASTTEVAAGETEPSGYTLRDYRVLGTFRSPRILRTANDLVVTGFLEQGLRSSFNFTRRGARVELARRLTRTVSVSGRYVIERSKLFEERLDPEDKPLIDRLFPQVRLSTMSLAVIRDTRDDLLAPTRGALIGWDNDVAARAIGSEVGFVKTFAQGFLYRRLPGRRAVVFATGARLGLASGFDRQVVQLDDNGEPVIGPDGEPVVDVVSDLPASERFFAGGDTSVRGYALDRLGTPATIDRNGFPTGGNAVFILNAELRVPLIGGLGAVGFMDAGNVFNRVGDFAFGAIKPTAGVGLRYLSPIGPIRVDLGFKLDRGRLPTGEQERLTELHISLGQAF
jgi:outer membrane protein assembly complex protein YaeT